jgi:outer membrane protein assembly factor BamB
MNKVHAQKSAGEAGSTAMPEPTMQKPTGPWIWLLGGLLLVGFALLTAYQALFANRTRFVPSGSQMEELSGVEFVEDPLPARSLGWPGWRGPGRLGCTREPELLVRWPPKGPSTLWLEAGGDGYSSFAVEKGLAFTMLAQADGQEAVVCWNASDGKERWRHHYTPRKTFDYGGPRATPTLDGSFLYTVSSAGNVLCLEKTTGKVAWEYDLCSELGASPPKWGFACSPLIEDNQVFVMAGAPGGRSLVALDKHTGKLVWSAQDDPAGYSSPIAITVAGVRQIVFFTGKRLLGVTPAGQLLWQLPWITSFDVNAATPLPIRARREGKELDYLFVSSGYKKGCALVRITAQPNGSFTPEAVYESNELCCQFATPVRRGSYLYALDESPPLLTCFDVRTGQVRWREPGFQKGSLLRINDDLLILGENGKLVLAEANPEKYVEKARCHPFRNRCWTMPVLAEGRLYLRDQSRILCLDLLRKDEE